MPEPRISAQFRTGSELPLIFVIRTFRAIGNQGPESAGDLR